MTQHRAPSYAVARAEPNCIVFGPANAIWLIACDWKDPVHGHASEAGMWWRYANISDPAEDGHIFRMNGQVTSAITDAANEPAAFVSTLAQAISATNDLDCEDICLFWHGIHISRAHANTPYRLRNANEEYYGQVHRRSAVTVDRDVHGMSRHDAAEERHRRQQEAAEETERRLAPARGNIHTEYVERPDISGSQYTPESVERVNRQNRRWAETVERDRDKRRTWDEMFMFGWPDHASHPRVFTPEDDEREAREAAHGRRRAQPRRPQPDNVDHAYNSDWPERYDNPNYVAVVRAFRDHPHARRIHLYGCDLADPEYLNAILDLTKDIAAGGRGEATVTTKEVWVYSDFTQTDWYGERMFISHTRRNPQASKGVRQLANGSYEVVRLHTEHGPLPGWQVRGRMDGSHGAIVEKLITERAGSRGHQTTTYKVEKIKADGISLARTHQVHNRTVTTSHYTPFEVVVAPDPTAPPPPPPAAPGRRRGR